VSSQIKIKWARGSENISFNRRSIFFVQGVPGSGKSAFVETVAVGNLEAGAAVLDLFGSRDSEGLAWLRSPYAKDGNILLLTGESVDVEAPCDVKKASALTLSDLERYTVIISASALYSNPDDEFTNAGLITDKVYQRFHWKRRVAVIIRECANFLYSRLKLTDTQQLAKSSMTYLTRESRHMGLSLLMDSLRWHSVDIDVRSLADYVILKSQGVNGLTRDLWFLYSIFKPQVIRNIPVENFYVVTRRGAVGAGEFKMQPWHKLERENILSKVGLKIEYGEPVETGEYKGTFRTIGDKEHAEIITLYAEGLSMNKISKQVSRSTKSIKDHIDSHNLSVERSAFCPSCRRVHSKLEGEKAGRA
jgi:hypothetical protein